MRFLYPIFALLSIFLLWVSCQPKTTRKDPGKYPTIEVIPDSVFIRVSRENVRQTPNGKILGTLRKGQKIKIDKKVVNWLKFYHPKFDSAYVWAPSAGFNYINLYSPHTYYNLNTKTFYSIDYFQRLFGSKGIRDQKIAGEYGLFFSELGLGSHEDIILEVVTESIEQVNHGVTLFVYEKTEKIYQIKVDFLKPVQGINAALKKCELKTKSPNDRNQGHIIWKKDSLVPGLTIDLERKEWESNWFSSIWFKLGD